MTSTITRKPNRYAGTCENCNRPVDAGKGYLVGKNSRHARWLIAHVDCDVADAAVRGHIAAARKAITDSPTPSSPYDRDLSAMTVAELEDLLDGVIDTHICYSEIDNIFDPGSDDEVRHFAAMNRMGAFAREIEAVLATRQAAA